MDIKKILIFVGFILAVIALSLALYFFIFRPLLPGEPTDVTPPDQAGTLPDIPPGSRPPGVTPGTPGDTGVLTQPDIIAGGRETLVSDYPDIRVEAVQPTTAGIAFYNPEDNTFYTLNANGGVNPLTDQKFVNVEGVTWSPRRTQAILEYPDGSNIVYDFTARRQTTLPRELEKFSFDSSGSRIAAIWDGGEPDNTWLMVGNADGSGLEIVEPVGNNKTDVQVSFSPDNQVVALYRKAANANQQEILPLGRNQENFRSFTVDGLKFESKYSPAGNYMLFNVSSAKDNYQPRLWLTEGETDSLGYSQTDLGLRTWAEKCTFDRLGSSLYCAVPSSLPEGAGLFPGLAKDSADSFYRVDITSGVRVPLALPVGSQSSYTAHNLFLSQDESLLYFTDQSTGRLHSIRLK